MSDIRKAALWEQNEQLRANLREAESRVLAAESRAEAVEERAAEAERKGRREAFAEAENIARERTSFSLESNPSERDRGWKRCAAVIADLIADRAAQEGK